MPNDDQIHTIRILALGDSYTIGTDVDGEERWPNKLAAACRQHGFQVPTPDFIAQNGWTTGDLLAAISSNPYHGHFDLVTLLIGVNNQFQGLDIDEYRQDFDLLLKKAIEYTGGNPRKCHRALDSGLGGYPLRRRIRPPQNCPGNRRIQPGQPSLICRRRRALYRHHPTFTPGRAGTCKPGRGRPAPLRKNVRCLGGADSAGRLAYPEMSYLQRTV